MVVNRRHLAHNNLFEYTHGCKNLYNYANYYIRACFITCSKAKNGGALMNPEAMLAIVDELNTQVLAYNEKRKVAWGPNCVSKAAKKQAIPEIPKPYLPFSSMHVFPSYEFMDFFCKNSEPYKALLASSAQQVLRQLEKNWISFFEAMKDWKINPNKYTGRPSLPKYLEKDGHFIAVIPTAPKLQEKEFSIPNKKKNSRTLPNRTVVRKGFILPKALGGLFVPYDKPHKVAQIRIVPKLCHFVVEVVYNVSVSTVEEFNGTIVSGDLGLDNFITLANNIGLPPLIIDGRKAKSVNQHYNKLTASLKSEIMTNLANERKNKKQQTNHRTLKGCTSCQIRKITSQRNASIADFIHKASKAVIDYAIECGASTIVIGKNKGWKQNIDLGTKTNQNFVQIPHALFIKKLEYKAKAAGIQVIITEESYTSKTSALDHEMPTKEVSDNHRRTAVDRQLPINRRKHRGLYVSNGGVAINADVNAAYQIMRKVYPANVTSIPKIGTVPDKLNVYKFNLETFRKSQQLKKIA